MHADEGALTGLGLERLGWTAAEAEAFRALTASPGTASAAPEPAGAPTPARVVVEHRDRFEVVTAEGVRVLELAGHLRKAAAHDPLQKPSVGDWVVLREGRIDAVLPRRTALIRKAAGRRDKPQVVATNVDVVMVVTAAGADVNVRRLERYAAAVAESGARAVLVLTKTDLEGDHDVRTLAAAWPAARVIVASGITGAGLDALRAELGPGRTGALVGSSGVGKSTLVNALVGRVVHGTGAVRESDARGKHTTTFRALVPIPAGDDRAGGGLLIDSPGMREVSAWDADEGVRATFEDVEALLGTCRFSDCAHQREPGCAIRAAIARGALAEARYDAFLELMEEQASRTAVPTAAEREEKRRAIKVLTKSAKEKAAQKRGRR